jgi:hypothetical protein
MRFDHWLEDHENTVRRRLRELRTQPCTGPSVQGVALSVGNSLHPLIGSGWVAAKSHIRTARRGTVGYGAMMAACLTITAAAPLLEDFRTPAKAPPVVEASVMPATAAERPPVQVAAVAAPPPPTTPSIPAAQADPAPILIASPAPVLAPALDRETERIALAEIEDRLAEFAAPDAALAEVRPRPRLVGARRELRIPPQVLAASSGKFAGLEPPRGYR